MLKEAGFDLVERHIALEKFLKGGGFTIGDAAGNDEVEIAEIGCNVIGKAVRGNPSADVNADGREFFFGGRGWDPDACFSGDAIGGDSEIGRGADHGFFESAHVPANVSLNLVEIEDRIADDLAGTMIGDISAAVCCVELDILLTEDLFGSEEMGAVGVAAEGDDVGVLAEEKDIFDGPGFTGGDQPLLERRGGGVGEEAEVVNEESRHRQGSPRVLEFKSFRAQLCRSRSF
jgi:hypothetical protein